MSCPKCGHEMNHQAAKLVPAVTAEDVAALTDAFDGLVEEIFACPGCGWIEARRADAATADGSRG